jgi:hypoxanthine-guanine phosphoribosyltransferase
MIATPGPGERVVAGERLEELIAAELIEARIVELGDRISRDYRGKQLHLVVVLKGAFVFAADLVRRICICALLRKPRARTGGPPLGYVGFEIGEDFVVGYGMDYGERYRGLCNIYRLLLNNAPRSKRPARGIDVFASLRCAFLRAYV